MKLNELVKPAVAMVLGVGVLNAGEVKQQFEPQKKWNYFGELKAADKNLTVVSKGEAVVANINAAGKVEKADFLFSLSVLEHVRTDQISELVKGLSEEAGHRIVA